MAQKQSLKVAGQTLQVSNLDKVLYPGNGFTKAQVIDFYIRVSKYLLPHLKGRPVTLKRYPDGVASEHFYEKDAPAYTPDWIRTFPVPRRGGGTDIRYIVIDDLPTLVWCANLANLELHPFLHKVPAIERPTSVVFDLDPGEGADVLTCAKVAFLLRDVLDQMKLKSFPKVSGSKGIQIHVPLNTPVDYGVTQPFAHTLAQYLEREHKNLVVSEMAKEVRKNRVFIDWSQNADHKTTVGVYSLRAKRHTPFVSMPVTWEELEAGDRDALYFNPEQALARLEKLGDLFAPVLKLKQKLPSTFLENLPAPTPLKEYKAKRNFAVTPEPAPSIPKASHQGARKRFVIQKHAASHLHYDFRLEMHGVLKSWAVPKGVPLEVDEKRLAMATEDHPMSYFDFEGIIPQGQYGGGTVMVWDIGTYELIEGNYYKGSLRFFLSGTKLKGEWMLVRTEANKWFLRKTAKPAKVKNADVSAISKRTMEQIAEQKSAVWQSNRSTEAKFVEPMQCLAVPELPEGDGWEYEIKLDGYRAIAVKKGGKVTLYSRNQNSLNDRFPEVVVSLSDLPDDTVVDGEIIALDEDGRPSFHVLQNYRPGRNPLTYYVFDVITLEGRDVSRLPLEERRELLRALPVQFLDSVEASVPDLIAAARKQGLEGIVAKRTNSVYEAGKRSGAWVKFRTNQGQELVIGGYLPGKNHFESLLAGYYEGDDLIFIAKIRNGFVPRTREEVARRFKGMGTAKCPFANLPEPKNARRGKALTTEAMKECCWLKPKLVAQVEFADWTEANHLRHSKFIALRDDKDAKEVRKEI